VKAGPEDPHGSVGMRRKKAAVSSGPKSREETPKKGSGGAMSIAGPHH
jgi:hypothetical protein